eukprot:TRINITY_DN14936_c0_g2_i1.p1 TRINITY_DN14936_c0_g2~~TRINITY_DN14936_c0_g2_i1.p1  ORF type:complete len:247 (-),score=32.86 TRINITY_DN14936_c0_g2_i1:10-750(-)
MNSLRNCVPSCSAPLLPSVSRSFRTFTGDLTAERPRTASSSKLRRAAARLAIAYALTSEGVANRGRRKLVEARSSAQNSQDVRGWLIVLDFDCTIARHHLWAAYQDAPLSEIPIKAKTFVHLEAFKAFVTAARGQSHTVAVATFGRWAVVDKALCFALGQDHGIVIKTPADFGYAEGSGALGDKNHQLAELCREFGCSTDRLLFIDDDARNIEAALEAGVGLTAWHAPHGLTEDLLARATELLKLK